MGSKPTRYSMSITKSLCQLSQYALMNLSANERVLAILILLEILTLNIYDFVGKL